VSEELDVLKAVTGSADEDTPPEVERRFQEMLLQRSGEDRMKMGCSAHQFAKMVVRASVLAANPSATSATVRQAVFLRFYGRDFDPAAQAKILRALEKGEGTDGGRDAAGQ
jgi:hypothetical protein